MLRKKLSGHKAADYKKSCKWGITGEEAKISAWGQAHQDAEPQAMPYLPGWAALASLSAKWV